MLMKILGKEVRKPLEAVGDISAMYTPMMVPPSPTPIPDKSLPTINIWKEGAMVIRRPPIWKTIAPMPIVRFLPMASYDLPPAKLPISEIMLKHPTRTSSWISVIFKSSFMNMIAPLSTPPFAKQGTNLDKLN